MLRNMTTIYIMDKQKILLLYRVGSKVVQPCWCGIGGHFEKDELNNPRACVLRELYEETGIKEDDLEDVELRYISLRKKSNEVQQVYYYFAKLHNSDIDITKCEEGTLEWVGLSKALEREMPFSAKECLKHYLSIGINDNKLYLGATTEGGVRFTELEEF